MSKKYQNVITDRPVVSSERYIVLAEYDSEEEATNHLEHDVEEFKEKYKHEAWYKIAYPFSWATIKEME